MIDWIRNFSGWQLLVESDDLNWTWNSRLKSALKDASEGKPLMIYFEGGPECSWCTKLENEVFRRVEFIKWAQEKKIVGLKMPWAPGETDFDRLVYHIEEELGVELKGTPTVIFLTVNSNYDFNKVESDLSKEWKDGFTDNWIKLVGLDSTAFNFTPKAGDRIIHTSAKNTYEFVKFSELDGSMIIRPIGRTLNEKDYIKDLSDPHLSSTF